VGNKNESDVRLKKSRRRRAHADPMRRQSDSGGNNGRRAMGNLADRATLGRLMRLMVVVGLGGAKPNKSREGNESRKAQKPFHRTTHLPFISERLQQEKNAVKGLCAFSQLSDAKTNNKESDEKGDDGGTGGEIELIGKHDACQRGHDTDKERNFKCAAQTFGEA
jgi:hypothetical protein